MRHPGGLLPGSCASPSRRNAYGPARDHRLEPQGSRAIRTAAIWGTHLVLGNDFESDLDSTSANRTTAKLRQRLRKARRSISVRVQRDAAAQLCRVLARQLFFRRAHRIALYLPTDGEISPLPIARLAIQLGKTCYLPVTRPGPASSLIFRRFEPGITRMVPNRFGIGEPAPGPGVEISARFLDIVLVPMVGFDPDGNRIGMGQGFYDRTFSSHSRWWRKPLLVGLAHDSQQIRINPNTWDVPMNYIATGSRLIGSTTDAERWNRSNASVFSSIIFRSRLTV